jgi:tetratricopeptide (TPR) repeat protein
MNSRIHSFIFLAIFFVTAVSQGQADTRWNSANAAYEQGKYEQAKADYIQMIDGREYSAELFYNLGNAWFKLNDQGRAIINYQRALILNPGFDEAKANLRTALKIVGNEDPKTIRDSLGVYADFFPAVASWGFWVAIFCFFGWLRKGARYSPLCGFVTIVAGILAVSSLAISIWIGAGSKDSKRALVIETAADLKYGPAVNARAVESLQIGEPVQLISARGDWTFCRANTGNLGWILSRKLERILPQPE